MNNKEEYLKIAEELPIEEDFTVPNGLLMPCGSQVLVRRLVAGSFITRGGIIIPSADGKVKGLHGVVMGIGPQVNLEAYPIKLGVKIEFKIGLEEDTMHQGIPYLLIDEFNIKGLVPPENFKHPKFPTNDELRRQTRIDATTNLKKQSDRKLDKIQNGTAEDNGLILE